jgi:hypothetical protein
MVDKPEQTVALTTYDTLSLYDRHARARKRLYTENLSEVVRKQGWRPMANADQPPIEPALARVTIFEVAERPWGWLTTSAEVDDRVYVGSREWRALQSRMKRS